jgi:hypothetical protein
MTLDKKLRESLKRQNWLAATKYRRNRYELVSDYKKYMKRDLQDLTILASKAPEDMLEEVFTPDKVGEFLSALLQMEQHADHVKQLVDKVNTIRKPIYEIQAKLNDSKTKLSAGQRQKLEEELKRLDAEIPWRQADEELRRAIDEINVRRAKLANLMVAYGVRYLIDQYTNVEQELPIHKLVTQSLLQAEQLAGSIVGKIEASAAAARSGDDNVNVRRA